jgi:hypothetical protein
LVNVGVLYNQGLPTFIPVRCHCGFTENTHG